MVMTGTSCIGTKMAGPNSLERKTSIIGNPAHDSEIKNELAMRIVRSGHPKEPT